MCLGLPPLPSSTPQACLWEDAVGEFMKTGHWFLFVLSSHLRPFTFSSPYTPPIPWERKLDHVRVRWVRADSRLDHLLASCSKGKTGEQLWSSAFHTWQNQGPEWLANELRFMCLENSDLANIYWALIVCKMLLSGSGCDWNNPSGIVLPLPQPWTPVAPPTLCLWHPMCQSGTHSFSLIFLSVPHFLYCFHLIALSFVAKSSEFGIQPSRLLSCRICFCKIHLNYAKLGFSIKIPSTECLWLTRLMFLP